MSKYRRVTYEDRCQIYALSKGGTSQESYRQRFGPQPEHGKPRAAPQSGSAWLSVQASRSEGSSAADDTKYATQADGAGAAQDRSEVEPDALVAGAYQRLATGPGYQAEP